MSNDRNNWLPEQSPKVSLQCWGTPSSVHKASVSDRSFCEGGHSEGLFLLVLAMFDSHILLCPACPIRTAYCQHSKQGFFFFTHSLWLTFATKKVSSMWNFFNYHYLLWSILVLSRPGMSHCHKKEEPRLLKQLNAIFCRSPKCLKLTCLSN